MAIRVDNRHQRIFYAPGRRVEQHLTLLPNNLHRSRIRRSSLTQRGENQAFGDLDHCNIGRNQRTAVGVAGSALNVRSSLPSRMACLEPHFDRAEVAHPSSARQIGHAPSLQLLTTVHVRRAAGSYVLWNDTPAS